MPSLLIVHASLGTGHRSAALALGAALGERPDARVTVVDSLDYATPAARAALKSYFRVSERAPLLYKLLFETSDSDDAGDSVVANRRLGRLLRPFLAQLEELIERAPVDAVICTHPLAANVLQSLSRAGRLRCPFYVVVTDFMAHSSWIAAGAAGYFLPSTLTRADLIERGLPPERLHVTGIPIAPEVMRPKATTDSRRWLRLPPAGAVITLLAGGLDPGRVQTVAAGLLRSPIEGVLVLVAGRNATLRRHIAQLTDGPTLGLRRLGRLESIDDLVVASDVIIGKAGGLTVSEVLARGTPQVIIDPMGGQEEWNADLVVAAGAGLQLRQPEMVAPAVVSLLSQPARLAAMREQARALGRPAAAVSIADHLLATLIPAPRLARADRPAVADVALVI